MGGRQKTSLFIIKESIGSSSKSSSSQQQKKAKK